MKSSGKKVLLFAVIGSIICGIIGYFSNNCEGLIVGSILGLLFGIFGCNLDGPDVVSGP